MKLGSDVAGTGHTDPKSAAAGVQNADRGILHNIDRSVELIAVDRLAPRKANARTHSRKQVRQIADSITRFGFCNPVLNMTASAPCAPAGVSNSPGTRRSNRPLWWQTR